MGLPWGRRWCVRVVVYRVCVEPRATLPSGGGYARRGRTFFWWPARAGWDVCGCQTFDCRRLWGVPVACGLLAC